ncbi:C4-dicarboxylate ABC transporter substrate-binding protein [Bacillus canaveralius]|uniref:C4-dicarboxylate ABC transporter substrate-binding protein n=2 Tax=Bacillaceae TaxID=186817 RepID=A0A2N5GK15_9BACI|nr:C4-dicarboxylate ABC transporter substrate-binding protein [Bacillus canaveralius]PLR87858.1 C4-dicarboxylate ABC transporter substrate-binding protein [Bacillus sp. V33-4]PLR89919.1 C4-dicarboxylate ABC transporter substrate-binding protein [Bacillus canaveralius]RSK55309.1 TRAP transporter substrate-binding protein [Bacillus canaveralius]
MKAFLTMMIGLMLVVLTGCNALETAGKERNGVTTIKIANYFSETHPQNIALREKFKPMVEEQTDGKYVVEIYPGNELGDEDSFTSGVRIGSIQMAITGMGLQTANPKIGAVEWPYLFDDYEQANRILNGEVGDEIGEAFRELGAEPLAWTANGFRSVSANREIASMEDFKGFRLRMTNIPIFINTGKALGANVQPLALSEVFTAIEQGVIDGQENPITTLKESGLYEVQSHVTETKHMFSPNVYLMNKEFFDGLDDETREIILAAAKESANYEWELLQESESETKQFLEEHGIKFTVPDEKFMNELRDSMEPVYEDLYKKYDWAEEFINKIHEQK